VRTARLADLWKGASELCIARNFQVDDLRGFCRTCYSAQVCKGGCVWTAASLLGRRGNNPYCHHRAIELLTRGKRERLVQVRCACGSVGDTALFEIELEDAPIEWVRSLPELPGAA
jgi:hypothetical protein